jgi:hypothetical protein
MISIGHALIASPEFARPSGRGKKSNFLDGL